MRRVLPLVLIVSIAPLFIVACAEMKQSKPILPVREYERMIVGRLDAEYVGTDNCVAKCHKHEKITDDFKHSVHGEQIKPEDGLPLVNCESCHGPGSLAIEKIEQNKLLLGEKKGNRCDTTKLLDLKMLPPQAQFAKIGYVNAPMINDEMMKAENFHRSAAVPVTIVRAVSMNTIWKRNTTMTETS